MPPSHRSNVIDIKNREPFDLTKAYLIASGAPILPLDCRQSVNTAQELYDLSVESEPDFLKEMDKISRALKLKTTYPGIKTISRIEQKAQDEKNGDVNLIHDSLRIAFITDRPSQIKKGLDFFSPAKNSRVVGLTNQFAVPDEESRIRRAKIIYQARSGLYTEIQIWSSKMMNAFEESHVPYEQQRGLKSVLLNSASQLPHKTLQQFCVKERLLGATRRSIHDEAALEADLDKFIEKRTFGTIGDIPIVAIERGLDICPTILRPDPKSGVYVEDNSLYSNWISGENYTKTSRDAFLRASHAIAIRHVAQMRLTGEKLAAPLDHFYIA